MTKNAARHQLGKLSDIVARFSEPNAPAARPRNEMTPRGRACFLDAFELKLSEGVPNRERFFARVPVRRVAPSDSADFFSGSRPDLCTDGVGGQAFAVRRDVVPPSWIPTARRFSSFPSAAWEHLFPKLSIATLSLSSPNRMRLLIPTSNLEMCWR